MIGRSTQNRFRVGWLFVGFVLETSSVGWIACQAVLSCRTSISLHYNWTRVVSWPTEVAGVISPAARDLVSTMRLARDVATAADRSVIKLAGTGCTGPAARHLLSVSSVADLIKAIRPRRYTSNSSPNTERLKLRGTVLYSSCVSDYANFIKTANQKQIQTVK